ncbi:MAG: bifunctional oligoribonuclease/PAP phosphatase NrnA [Candidatus Magasanikbacteria bacterium]|nr:bifunctional oligoribonuclease/PAP phosphatase NrnA [Candidatus Magasanikbacteria bacterium]MBT4071228.1 bifunctional oligoribonuclease/PAP phosphatase NrnA [Candidatus Magasanikbacteria bacterium]
MGKFISQQIHTRMQRSKHVLLVPHKHPDGDALGALTAFSRYLDRLDISHSAYCSTDISSVYNYIIPTALHWKDETIWEDTDIDTVVVFDTGDLRHARIDNFIKKRSDITVVNIDHHITNNSYGKLNLVFPTLSSTCEIIFHYLKANKQVITEDIATSLLTGIITDTGNFTNSATTKEALFIGSKLIQTGADFHTIQKQIFKRLPIDALKLWGLIFSRLEKHEKFQLVHTFFKHDDIEKFNVQTEDLEGLTNFLNAIHEGHAGMLLKEQKDGSIKGSFRTTREDVDVSAMAKHFGGGGHRKAAGFSVKGPIEDALSFILKELEQLFPQGGLILEE